MTALAALAAAAIAPPEGDVIPATLEPALRLACAGAWRAVEVLLAGDVLRGRLGKTRDTIVRDAVESLLALHGNVGIRADALAALRTARDEGALDGPLDLAAVIVDTRGQGAVAAGRVAVTAIRRGLTAYPELDQVLADAELASLLVDGARAIFRGLARDPELTRWAIGPTGSPGRDRALAAFAELAASPESVIELETLIAMPIHLDDNVQFTVYRPRAIDPGKWHQLLAFAHLAERRPGEDDLPDPALEVQRQAASVLGDKAKQYQPIVQDSGAAIPAEGELTFVPEFPGIEVNPPRRSFLWLETVHREEFRIRAGRELDGKTVRGRVSVFLGHIAIAEVACTIKVDAARPEPTKREPTSVRAYRKIFASYSHRDLDIVNQFETYARALGDEYLRDWVHLRTGEVWTDRLCQLIDQADAFQLFWSKNSMHSQFVRQEYEYALSLGRPSFVRPTYWESPMPTAPGLPPESLLRLHFQKLGSEMIGAAGRADGNANVVARKKRAEPKLEKVEQDAKLDQMVMERERAPISVSDTDQWAHHPELELDVTDPQYSLPEMPVANESMSMPIAPPAAESRRRLASAAPPLEAVHEHTDDSPAAFREEVSFSDVSPVVHDPDTARIETKSAEHVKREQFDPHVITTEPGVGQTPKQPAGVACPNCTHRNPSHVKFCLGCGTPLGASPPAASPMKSMMAEPMPAPGPSAPAKFATMPTTSPGVAPTRPSSPAQARPSSSQPPDMRPIAPIPDVRARPMPAPSIPSSAQMPAPSPMPAPSMPGVARPAAPGPSAPASPPSMPGVSRPAPGFAPTQPMHVTRPAPDPSAPASPSSAPMIPSAPAARPIVAPMTTAPGVVPLQPTPAPSVPGPRAPASPSSAPMITTPGVVLPSQPVPSQPMPAPSPMAQPAHQPMPMAAQAAASPIPTTSPGVAPTPARPIPTTSPGIAPAPPPPSGVSARPQRPSEAPLASADSPWQRPETKELAPAASVVSPYAPTVPQETYKPVPGDPLYEQAPAAKSEDAYSHAPKSAKGAPSWRPEQASRRSMLPLVLVAIGVLALVVVLLVWLRG